MRRIGGIVAMLGGAAALAVAAAPAPACGCGIALRAQGASERAYVGFGGGREDLVVSLGLKAKSHAAVVLPVPSTPSVGLAPSGRELFTYLKRTTAPRTVIVHRTGPPPPPTVGAPGGGSQPVVVGTKSIGGYTITRLRGGTSATLLAWLNANGYTLPAKAQPILGDYVKAGWSFVAIRLGAQVRGLLQPLRVRFRTAQPVYPLRLGQLSSTAIALDLWTVGAHRMRASPLTTDFAGPTTALRAAAPAGVRRYLTGAWLTHLSSDYLPPEEMHHDLLPVPAPRDVAYRLVIRRFVYSPSP